MPAASMTGDILGTYSITMHVHDLGAARRFWAALGLAELAADDATATFGVPGSGPLTVHVWSSACATTGGRPPGTVTGIMLATDDAAAACARVARAGGKVVAPPFPAPDGGSWSVVADPDGNEFMLCQPA